jgi:hypothetical protein
VELMTIARKCGLPIRLVRYVLDHPVLPGSSPTQAKNERGQPRSFSEVEAFAIAIAGHLLRAGIKRPNVACALKELIELKYTFQVGLPDAALGTIQVWYKPSVMRVGLEGHLISVSLAGVVAPGPHAKANRSGVVSIDVDLAVIRMQLFPKKTRG